MKLRWFDRALLGMATIFLGAIALRPLFAPPVARAQSQTPYLYVEPGIHMLNSPDRERHVKGKVVVDLNTGNVWGFPTASEYPYPVDNVKPAPATSSPIYLGRFDLAAMMRQQ